MLHVSDIHCNVSGLRRLLRAEDYDLVAATGDFECVEAAEALVEEARGAVLAVTGNLDNFLVEERLGEAGVLLDGRAVEQAGLRWAGIGGRDPLRDAERLRGAAGVKRVDVLLSHYPPRGVVDLTHSGCRGGLEEVRRLVEELSPRLVLCGHIHEARGVGRLGGAVVVNAGPLLGGSYAVIELGEGEPRVSLRRLA